MTKVSFKIKEHISKAKLKLWHSVFDFCSYYDVIKLLIKLLSELFHHKNAKIRTFYPAQKFARATPSLPQIRTKSPQKNFSPNYSF